MGIYEELCRVAGKEHVLRDEPMERHTTFRVGGPADYFVMPGSEEQTGELVSLLRGQGVPFYVIGNGSNLLVGDKGYRGVIIQIYKNMNRVRVEGETIYAQAGALLSKIAAYALAGGLAGFEFASGIPGTLGGAVMMNAGAYGGEMRQVLQEVYVFAKDGTFKVVPAEQMGLGYRSSNFAGNHDIVLRAAVRLERGSEENIRRYMEILQEKRTTKQPLEYPSAGSTFKRPEGYYVGKLIQDAGLRGFQSGGAQVSEKHCGFIINRGHATAADIISVMGHVTETVEAQFGVRLEPEVKRIGEF